MNAFLREMGHVSSMHMDFSTDYSLQQPLLRKCAHRDRLIAGA